MKSREKTRNKPLFRVFGVRALVFFTFLFFCVCVCLARVEVARSGWLPAVNTPSSVSDVACLPVFMTLQLGLNDLTRSLCVFLAGSARN